MAASLCTMSYYGADKVVNRYNMMGPVKAALEASVRYVAAELGPRGVRVFAVSPGPLRTRAASGISHFDELVQMAQERARRNVWWISPKSVAWWPFSLAGPPQA